MLGFNPMTSRYVLLDINNSYKLMYTVQYTKYIEIKMVYLLSILSPRFRSELVSINPCYLAVKLI